MGRGEWLLSSARKSVSVLLFFGPMRRQTKRVLVMGTVAAVLLLLAYQLLLRGAHDHVVRPFEEV
jgi:hypothetical protein